MVRLDGHGRRRLDTLRWGLVPYWAKEATGGARAINARSETAATRPTFREPLRRRRCLVLADGFFEWRKEAGGRAPFLFRLADGEPFAFAGLWDRWRDPEAGALETFTVLTTRPNERVAAVHDRMPVILAREELSSWLEPREQTPEALEPMLDPYPAEAMVAWPVSPRVNDPRIDEPACVAPVA